MKFKELNAKEIVADIIDVDVWNEELEDYEDRTGFVDYENLSDGLNDDCSKEFYEKYCDYVVKSIDNGHYGCSSYIQIEIAKE